MDLPLLERLLTPTGQVVLSAAVALQPREADFLRLHRQLSKQHAPDLARAALETALLRQRARVKFSRAERMYFEREALEQASGETVSSYRAERLRAFSTIADLCCGLGGDAIAFAAHSHVLAVDLDPLRVALARANLEVYERHERVTFLECDVLQMQLQGVKAAFCDPDRRSEGKRHVSVRSCRPPLQALLARCPAGFPLGVKLAPAIRTEELTDLDAETEFISLEGELKECVLWFGELRSTARRATVLPGPHTLTFVGEEPLPVGPPAAFLYDPDPAVIRAGVLGTLGCQLNAHQLDPHIAFLTAEQCQFTPFARVFTIEANLPFERKRLTEALRTLKIGQIDIVRRGSAVDPETLLRQLKLSGSERRTLVLTRVHDKPWALVCRPMMRE